MRIYSVSIVRNCHTSWQSKIFCHWTSIYLTIPRPTYSHKTNIITKVISNHLKSIVQFLICKLHTDMGKDEPNSPPPPPCYSFGDSPATPDGVLVNAGHSFGESFSIRSRWCQDSAVRRPLPPCGSQGRKVLRWKPRDARPPAATCSLLQPSAINSPPSKTYPALSHSYCGRSAPFLSELQMRFCLPEVSGFPRELKRPFPNQPHQFGCRKVPFSFAT